jgi:phosphatidylserine decarboxylase
LALAPLPPIHAEGWKFLPFFAAGTLLLFWLWPPSGWIGLVLSLWCLWFFRDPPRFIPEGEALVLSPADGVVSQIGPAPPPEELGLGAGPLTRISVFMSVFNCHVNRAPLAGRVAKVAHRPGKFVNAALDKASADNERRAMVLETAAGIRIVVVQIAGLVARRIVGFAGEGADLRRGERFGLIRFGSRLDVYLPEGVAPLVAVGQTMVAGESILADLSGAAGRGARAE